MKTEPKIDAYINKSKDFAKPILNHLRKLIHQTCSKAEEKIKWGFPHFDYKGEMMCSMASFKAHCAFTFWKGSIMADPNNALEKVGRTAMGQFGRITSLKDLPADKVIVSCIREAMRLNDEGIKLPARTIRPSKEIPLPDYYEKALKKNPKAWKTFSEFSPGHKKEYILWVTEAKQEATRKSRMEKSIEMMSEGKTRNYKYERKNK